MLQRILLAIDRFSMTVGHAFAWCILILTLGTSYEVFVRYVLKSPTSWAYDMGNLEYGALFLMSGAYTLSRNAHVRGDFIFRMLRPRVQASIELVLYFIFFYPGVTALIIAGYGYAHDSFGYKEVSVNSPAGIPIWQLKALIPLAGILLFVQGFAQVIRCILTIRTGRWPRQLHDVEELESVLIDEHAGAAK
ncbi:MAG TPA: TRAP transporter small permease subunit [Usitatibacter sp.]|jgi:TRAP-type mannitol/chloroaromatic compound transport system permease small subunit|nr:TRAP transporter small permease subunit [Usitatibacter sp.]